MNYVGGVIKIYTNNNLVVQPNNTNQNEEAQKNNSVILTFTQKSINNQSQSIQQMDTDSIQDASVILDLNGDKSSSNIQENSETSNTIQPSNTFVSPFGFFFGNNTKTQVSLETWTENNLLSLGAIKANNPIEYSMIKAKADKNFIDAFIATVKDKIEKLHIYERVNKNQNLYQYSINANGKNLKINEWINARENTLNYNLSIQTEKYSFREWINVNTETQKVNYGLNIETPKFKVNEWFNGTAADYSYSLDISRKSSIQNLFEERENDNAKFVGPFAMTKIKVDTRKVTDIEKFVEEKIGSDYKVVSWEELEAFAKKYGVDTLNKILSKLGLTEYESSAIVSYKGSVHPGSQTWAYFISRHDGKVPSYYYVVDGKNIGNHLFDLGRWYGNYYVLAINKNFKVS